MNIGGRIKDGQVRIILLRQCPNPAQITVIRAYPDKYRTLILNLVIISPTGSKDESVRSNFSAIYSPLQL